MTARVFVPVTDEMMEAPDCRQSPLVPYDPDRPCWRFDPPDPEPSRQPATRRQRGNHAESVKQDSRSGSRQAGHGNRE